MENLHSFDLFRHIVLADFLRYFVPASLAYLAFWVIFKKYWQHRVIQKKPFRNRQLWAEFGYSMSTVLIFAAIGFGILTLKRAGFTLIYDDFGQYGGLWFAASVVLMVLLHDTYFYWTHRLMHHPKIFRHVHLVHHRSTNPSPWAAYAFHPFEAVLEAGIFPIIVFAVPAHPLALFIFLTHMILRNVLGHLGVEFLPKNFLKNRWFNWNISTTHHDLHHKDFQHNYGFYFTWWDKFCGTEHPKYRQVFEEVTHREQVAEKPKNSENSAAKALSAVVFMVLMQTSAQAQTPVGTWKTVDDGDGKARSLVKIEASGEGLSGKVLDIFPRDCEPADPICAKCAGERKNAPIRGMSILWGFKKTDDGWQNGYILDPANGKTYRCKMWLENGGNTLKVRGFWGIFWRTQAWFRAE